MSLSPLAIAQEQAPLKLVVLESPTENGCELLEFKILSEVLTQRLNTPFECEPLPWARAQKQVELGEKDGYVALRTPERSKYTLSTSEPVMELATGIFTFKQHPRIDELQKITTVPQIKGFTVGAYLGDGWVKQNLNPLNIDVQYAQDLTATLKMLAAQRIDMIIEPEIDTLKLIHELKLEDDLVLLPTSLYTGYYYLMLSKTSPYVNRIPEIDRTLKEMKADGTMKRLINAYQTDRTPTTPEHQTSAQQESSLPQ